MNEKLMRVSSFFLWLIAFFVLMIFFSPDALALGSSSNPASGHDQWAVFQLMVSLGGAIWYVIKITLLISGVVGILFIILGLLKIRASALDSQGGQSHLKHGIILVILGGLLFGAPTLMMISGYSLFGSAPSPVATTGNVNCQMVNNQYSEGCGTPCISGSASQNPDGTGTCQCPPGTDQSSNCKTCGPGEGNSDSGGACTTCPQGWGTSAGICVQCTGNTGVIGGVCTPCSGASYGQNGECTSCGQGFGVNANATGCVNCNANNQIVAASGVCQTCSQGSGYNAGQCTPCGQGYGSNSANANGLCVPCNGTGAFSEQQGNIWACVMCPSGSTVQSGNPGCQCSDPNATFTASGAGVCTCNSGYFGSGTCTACGPSSYGEQAQCPCANAMYGESGYLGCLCSSVGYGTASYPNCQCSAGSVPNSNATACTVCSAGTSAAAGASTCTPCPSDSYSVAGGVCSSCGTYAVPNGTQSGCQTYVYNFTMTQGDTPVGCALSGSVTASTMTTVLAYDGLDTGVIYTFSNCMSGAVDMECNSSTALSGSSAMTAIQGCNPTPVATSCTPSVGGNGYIWCN